MNEAVSKMVSIAVRLAGGQLVGKPSDEGYFPRGIIVNEVADRTGAERVVDILLKKLQGKPFEPEVVQRKYSAVKPADPIKIMASATIALVTDGGLGPQGNPDKIESRDASKFGRYSIEKADRLKAGDYAVFAGGYSPNLVNENPNRLVPVDAMRQMEKDKIIGKLYSHYFATAGIGTKLGNARKFAQAIAAELKGNGVSGVLLTSS